jgi:hypothetical protein
MYWFFGLALSCAIAVAVGKQLVEDHGRRIVPLIAVGALIFGLLAGWALTRFIAYVQVSETTRY